MIKIHFTSTPKIPSDKVNDWVGYVKGSVHEVNENEAERWVNRGVADLITTRAANILLKENEEVKEEKIEEVGEVVEEIKSEEIKLEDAENKEFAEIAPPVYQPHRRR